MHMNIAMRRLIIGCLVMVASVDIAEGQQPAPVAAQPAEGDFKCTRDVRIKSPFSGFTAYEENDSLAWSGDDRYSQGLRVTFAYHPLALPCFVQRITQKSALAKGFALSLGQGLYTPRIITSRTLDSNDRGFADFNYIGAELSLTDQGSDPKLRHTFQVNVGALGRAGLGYGAQGGLHALKMSRIPKGWPTTRPNAPGIDTFYRWERRASWLTENKWKPDFDFTYGLTGQLGSVRGAAGATAAVRFGWNLTGFPQSTIAQGVAGSAARKFELGFVGGLDGRAVGWTQLVQSTPGTTGFRKKHGVYDLRAGVSIRYDSVRVGYQYVSRSAEFSITRVPDRSQEFGSVSVSYEPGEDLPTDNSSWWTRGQIELGMGTSYRGPRLNRPKSGGVTGHTAIRKDLLYGFTAGLELSSVAVEGGPIPSEPANNTDLILRQSSMVLGWQRDTRLGSASVRAGRTFKGSGKLQTVTHNPENGRTEEQVDDGRPYPAPAGGWLFGTQYFLPLERHMTIGLDVTYHRLKVHAEMPHIVNPNYVKAIILVRIRQPGPKK